MKKLKFICGALSALIYFEQSEGASETLRVLGELDQVQMNRVESLIQKTKRRYEKAVRKFGGTRIETDAKNGDLLHIRLNGKWYDINRNNPESIEDETNQCVINAKIDTKNERWVKLQLIHDASQVYLNWSGNSIIITDVHQEGSSGRFAVSAKKVYTLGDLDLSDCVLAAEDGFVNLGAKIKADNFKVLSCAFGNYGNIWDGWYKKDTIDFSNMPYLEAFEVDRFFKKITTQSESPSFLKAMFAFGYNGTGNIYAKNIYTKDLDIHAYGGMQADSIEQTGEAQYNLKCVVNNHVPYFSVRNPMIDSDYVWMNYFNPLGGENGVYVADLTTTDLRIINGQKNDDGSYVSLNSDRSVKIGKASDVEKFTTDEYQFVVANGYQDGTFLHEHVTKTQFDMQQLYDLNCFSDDLTSLLKDPKVEKSGDGWIRDENGEATSWKYYVVLENREIPVSFTKDDNGKFCFFHQYGCVFSDEVDGFLNAVWDIKQHPELVTQQSEIKKEEEDKGDNKSGNDQQTPVSPKPESEEEEEDKIGNKPENDQPTAVSSKPESEEEEEDKGDNKSGNDQPTAVSSKPESEEEEEDKGDNESGNDQPVAVNQGPESEEEEENSQRPMSFSEKLSMWRDKVGKDGWKAYLVNLEAQKEIIKKSHESRRDNQLNEQQRQTNIKAFNKNDQSNNE